MSRKNRINTQAAVAESTGVRRGEFVTMGGIQVEVGPLTPRKFSAIIERFNILPSLAIQAATMSGKEYTVEQMLFAALLEAQEEFFDILAQATALDTAFLYDEVAMDEIIVYVEKLYEHNALLGKKIKAALLRFLPKVSASA